MGRDAATARPDGPGRVLAIDAGAMRYGVEDTLRLAGVTDPALHEAVVAFWKARFFTDEYCLEDVPVRGRAGVRARAARARPLPRLSHRP